MGKLFITSRVSFTDSAHEDVFECECERVHAIRKSNERELVLEYRKKYGNRYLICSYLIFYYSAQIPMFGFHLSQQSVFSLNGNTDEWNFNLKSTEET